MSKDWKYCYKDPCLGYSLADESEYGYSFLCSNCKTKIHIAIKKGVTIKEVVDTVRCRNCGITQSSIVKTNGKRIQNN